MDRLVWLELTAKATYPISHQVHREEEPELFSFTVFVDPRSP